MSLIEWHAPRSSWTIEVWQNEDKFESMFTGGGCNFQVFAVDLKREGVTCGNALHVHTHRLALKDDSAMSTAPVAVD